MKPTFTGPSCATHLLTSTPISFSLQTQTLQAPNPSSCFHPSGLLPSDTENHNPQEGTSIQRITVASKTESCPSSPTLGKKYQFLAVGSSQPQTFSLKPCPFPSKPRGPTHSGLALHRASIDSRVSATDPEASSSFPPSPAGKK